MDILADTDSMWGNSLVEYEDTVLLGRVRDKESSQYGMPARTDVAGNIAEASFYFNIPRNDNLLSYLTKVAARLYKIRNSLNIEGVKRTLALFSPPIDPGMLVKAKAAGLSINDILSDAGASLPYYRFRVMLGKTLDIAHDLRNMGESLLQALKDKDAESLAKMRVSHELAAKNLADKIFTLQQSELEQEAASLELEKERSSPIIRMSSTSWRRLMPMATARP